MKLPTGKLPPDLLARLLAGVPRNDPRVLVWPGIGLDAAVIALDDECCLVAKTDPISFATDAIGWYAVQVCANDIATTGAAPRWFLATLLLPETDGNADLAEAIFGQVRAACENLGVSLVGGHSEITYGLDRPIVVGAMLGEVARQCLVSAWGARPGDAVLLTKGIAIEATAIMAREKAGGLAREKASELGHTFEPAFLERCQGFLVSPGISVVKDARIACQAGRVHAMHDPTEGGLANGLWEMAQAAGVGLLIDAECVPVYEETLALCRVTGLAPWGLIASGALLLSVEAADAEQVMDALKAEGIRAARIGQVTQSAGDVLVRQSTGVVGELPRFDRDEIARLFE